MPAFKTWALRPATQSYPAAASDYYEELKEPKARTYIGYIYPGTLDAIAAVSFGVHTEVFE